MSDTKMLCLAIQHDEIPDLNSVFETFAARFPAAIISFCNINPNTEYQLGNFGPGSAWLFESPYRLALSFEQREIILAIEDMT